MRASTSGINIKPPIDSASSLPDGMRKDEAGPLRGHLDSPANRYHAHARIGIVLFDRPDAGLRIYRLHLSLTMANAVIDVVIASDTKNPDVIARMVEFGGGLSCAKIRYRPDPGTGLSESLM